MLKIPKKTSVMESFFKKLPTKIHKPTTFLPATAVDSYIHKTLFCFIFNQTHIKHDKNKYINKLS